MVAEKILVLVMMLEKFFYATIITVLLPILLEIYPFSQPKTLKPQEVTQKYNPVPSYVDRFSVIFPS
ncbi:hypothetical protein ACP6PK_05830 [Dapis sp. BLCC M172]|uniref:hypothetical protein n=2 Tax=Microcoleaceae TaxID=1892252 RepID=UPI000B9BD4AB|nr:hypothetical protein [Hydrocoleum sp. CS-953]OZH54209.1 hypothetical protein AFK68_12360 [Hydrocoleum sp. CS-953]